MTAVEKGLASPGKYVKVAISDKPNHAQSWGRKATGARGIVEQEPGCRGPDQKSQFFVRGTEAFIKMRCTIINKILSFQVHRKEEGCPYDVPLERTFTALFGREVYEDNKLKQRR